MHQSERRRTIEKSERAEGFQEDHGADDWSAEKMKRTREVLGEKLKRKRGASSVKRPALDSHRVKRMNRSKKRDSGLELWTNDEKIFVGKSEQKE